MILFLYSCKKDKKGREGEIPYVPVNLYIYLDDPLCIDLKVIGNSINVSGGYAGIIIYRESVEHFLAFDRACTYDITVSCGVQKDTSGLFLKCPCCHSCFYIHDGQVTYNSALQDKQAKAPLKKYEVTFDQNQNIIYISNQP